MAGFDEVSSNSKRSRVVGPYMLVEEVREIRAGMETSGFAGAACGQALDVGFGAAGDGFQRGLGDERG